MDIEARLDRLQERLPGTAGEVMAALRRRDVLLYASGLAFYALVSIAPLVITVLWVLSLLLGDDRVRRIAEELRRAAPENLGAGQAFERVAQQGTTIALPAVIVALWPATAYGSGLQRAFVHLSGARMDLKGLRGRGLMFLFLLPLFVFGALGASLLGTVLLGEGALGRAGGLALALVLGFLGAGVGLVVIYRLFPPGGLSWRGVLLASTVTATGASVLSLGLVLYATLGANFKDHYASSSVAAVVLLAVWLLLANALMLVGYVVARRHD